MVLFTILNCFLLKRKQLSQLDSARLIASPPSSFAVGQTSPLTDTDPLHLPHRDLQSYSQPLESSQRNDNEELEFPRSPQVGATQMDNIFDKDEANNVEASAAASIVDKNSPQPPRRRPGRPPKRKATSKKPTPFLGRRKAAIIASQNLKEDSISKTSTSNNNNNNNNEIVSVSASLDSDDEELPTVELGVAKDDQDDDEFTEKQPRKKSRRTSKPKSSPTKVKKIE